MTINEELNSQNVNRVVATSRGLFTGRLTNINMITNQHCYNMTLMKWLINSFNSISPFPILITSIFEVTEERSADIPYQKGQMGTHEMIISVDIKLLIHDYINSAFREDKSFRDAALAVFSKYHSANDALLDSIEKGTNVNLVPEGESALYLTMNQMFQYLVKQMVKFNDDWQRSAFKPPFKCVPSAVKLASGILTHFENDHVHVNFIFSGDSEILTTFNNNSYGRYGYFGIEVFSNPNLYHICSQQALTNYMKTYKSASKLATHLDRIFVHRQCESKILRSLKTVNYLVNSFILS